MKTHYTNLMIAIPLIVTLCLILHAFVFGKHNLGPGESERPADHRLLHKTDIIKSP